MTVVLDASAVAAALADAGPKGRWAEDQLQRGDLVAPHLMPAEVASVLRRAVLTGQLSREAAGFARAHLLALPVELMPFTSVASRVWELDGALTPYDAWYVAVAELLGAPLVTLDLRLTRAPQTRCEFVVPPGQL